MSEVNLKTVMEKSTELKQAVKEGNIPKIVELVESGAPTDLEIGGVPILIYAAQRDLWDVVEELFVLNADLDIKYEILNWALIHQMAQVGKDVQLSNYLPFIQDKFIKEGSKGQNALMIAIDANRKSTYKILLENGLELRSTDNLGNNGLHYLAKSNWIDEIKEVAESNFQLLTLPNKKGETVLSILNMQLSDFVQDEKVSIMNNISSNQTESVVVESDTPEVEQEIEKPAKKKLSKVKKIS